MDGERMFKEALSGPRRVLREQQIVYNEEEVNPECVEPGDVFKILQATKEGLTGDQVTERLGIFGPNKPKKEGASVILQFLSFMWNPLSWVMESAAIVTTTLFIGESKSSEWPHFVGILLLLLINSVIGFYEEYNAGKAVKKLMDLLALKAKVKRDGIWSEIESSNLVPGDMISFKIGNIVPADCRLTEAINVSIDQAVLTGESPPQGKKTGDQCFSGSTCKQGEAEGVVIATGPDTLFGRVASFIGIEDDRTVQLQRLISRIGSFCLVVTGIFVVLEVCILYGRFSYSYRRLVHNILVLLIGGIPIAMPIILPVTLAVGARQLAKCKAIITRISAIEELAGVNIICAEKTGTLTTNQFAIDKKLVRTYGPLSSDDIILLSAYASRTENPDIIDGCIIDALDDPKKAREGIKLLRFIPFDPVNHRAEITYREEASGKIRRVSKGMIGAMIDLCTRNKTEELEDQLEYDVEEYATRGIRTLGVAYEEVEGDDPEAEGNGFEFLGLLPIIDPPRADSKEAIDDALALGLKVKIVTSDQRAIAKETSHRIGLGDQIYAAKVLREGPPPGSNYTSLEDMILHADGFAGVFPEHRYEIVNTLQGIGHLCAITGEGANDVPVLAKANVGIATEGATDVARGAADIVLTEPGFSTIVHAIHQSRVVFQRMRSYSIYACALTIRVVVCFSILAFAYQYDFPPFMVLIIAFINGGTIMTLFVDCVLPSSIPDSWNLTEIFSYAVVYGFYLAMSTVTFLIVILETNFFENNFGVSLSSARGTTKDPNDPIIHMIIYLQVAVISQALIFITRSPHGFFLMERPPWALLITFCISQLVSSIIAVYGNWPFTQVTGISGSWIGIVWVWNIVWFLPLDVLKVFMKAAVVEYHLQCHKRPLKSQSVGVPTVRMTSRVVRVYESLYSNRVNFLKRAIRSVGFSGGKKVHMNEVELKRFVSIQATHTGKTLVLHSSHPQQNRGNI